MKLKKQHIILLLLGALFLGFIGSYVGVNLATSLNQTSSQNDELKESKDPITKQNVETPKDMQKVAQAYSLIKQHFVEKVDDKQLIEGAIQGMLTSLEDPYSSYMDEEMMEQFNEQIESSFEGIGAEVSMVNNNVTIVAPIKNSPAEKAGLRPNDQVLTVDGESLEGLDLQEAVAKIRGEKGSEVVLEIMRPGSTESLSITLVRDTIPVETVYSKMENRDGKKTGMIEITNFSERTSAEFKEQLTDLEEKGMDGLIIDVRGNPGGLLNSVEEILQNFVPKDVPYVQIEDRDGKKDKYFTELDEKKDYPIEVLINEGSASASEILAVAMKEIGYDIVGTNSFGKGTVQQAVELGDGSTVKLTFYKWLSPKGNWIHEKGIEPTIKQEQPEYYFTNPLQIEKPLSYDHTGDKVQNLQMMLHGLKYYDGREDGYFDKETEKAVKAFQKDNKLKQTGIVDEQTASLVEAKIIEHIRNGEDDQQLEKALQELYK
ncbi:S41 family peptidase [Virgibacillus soli]|uniref:S41 family peptidase n=1 Tax=Paracerasibacillus soli TaxID=480284 RepID=A0ABU5CRN6_9BACI|nr:S41 family peptidase [Virgibacillus soli]MDY0408905.1 S41 family peptidase [Virgibacillus soli]